MEKEILPFKMEFIQVIMKMIKDMDMEFYYKAEINMKVSLKII